MGTSLNGLTPASTYQGLIKTTDNAAISGTAKYLSDGLGNDSVLALSTSRVGIGTASPSATLNIKSTTSNNSDNLAQVVTNSEFRLQYRADDISSLYIGGLGSERGFLQGVNAAENAGADISLNPYGGNVGIGTTAPTGNNLELFNDSTGGELRLSRNSGNQRGIVAYGRNNSGSFQTCAQIISESDSGSGNNGLLRFITTQGTGTLQDRLRIDADGLKFNGDTATANALDDYEEGTWTGTLTPSTSGAITLITGTQPFGYTKIGRQVTVMGLAVVQGVTSPVGNRILLGGLPFTPINDGGQGRGGGAVTFFDSSASYLGTAINGYIVPNTANAYINFESSLSLGVNDEFAFTFTYFV